MTMDNFDLNSIISEMKPEKRKAFLDALQPNKLTDEAKRKISDALQPIDLPSIYQNMLKENPSILENTGNITANALARDCIFRSKMYNLLNL